MGWRKALWIALALLVALPLLLWLLVDLWLESAGGRQALERVLSQRSGLPVRVEGEFRVMLLPTVGASGTALVVGAPASGGELLRSEAFGVSLALLPLVRGTLQVESIALEGGVLYLERLPASEPGAGADAEPVALPDIDSLLVQDFQVTGLAADGQVLRVHELAIDGFAERRETPFRLEVEGLGRLAGQLRWEPDGPRLAMAADWTGLLPGTLQLELDARLGADRGQLTGGWQPAAAMPEIRAAFDYALQDEGIDLPSVTLGQGPLTLAGDGCWRTDGTGLHLLLATGRLDYADLPDPASLLPPAADSGEGELPFAVNLLLRADEFLAGDVIARAAEFQLGGLPDCSGMRAAAEPIQ
jgi:hypothetical protein